VSTPAAEIDPRRRILGAGLRDLHLALGNGTLDQMLRYLELIEKWNRVYNLTAIRSAEAMIPHHILDSLTVLPWVRGERVVDVGSGAGLPGIPIALARPEIAVTLLEIVDKKTAFLQQAVGELRLPNVTVVRERVENWEPVDRFDVVVARAFAETAEFVRTAGHLVRPGGRILAMKGLDPATELHSLPPGIRVAEVRPVSVPGLAAARHVVVLERL